ncbi:hypothetical protein ACVIHI_002576 [Bradyrhizobium sp. USDA 4524]|uniref:hypothetical protein n=2 Tax=Bradyrhizobium TaxID=374 RepID=UPI00209E4FBB|nr:MULTISPECIES: hypothetical protein [unclassified Bradyrhizobium]MCP1905068.1 hypothetical protein [Bradyrhizobium sp. USDA 4537]MCP1989276.1 hypothetical protein [Bradyrhizobium sp. USDA 4539]
MAALRKNAKRTRGRPFAVGNAGRPKGARNKTTVMAEALLSQDIESVVGKVVSKAKRGDMQAARLILDRIMPPRRGRTVRFPLPKLETPADVVSALATVTKAMAAGQLSPAEAVEVAGVIEMQRRAIETQQLETRLHALEDRFR